MKLFETKLKILTRTIPFAKKSVVYKDVKRVEKTYKVKWVKRM